MQAMIDMNRPQAPLAHGRIARERIQQHARIRAAAVTDDEPAGRQRGEGMIQMVGNRDMQHDVITPETGRICNAASVLVSARTIDFWIWGKYELQ